MDFEGFKLTMLDDVLRIIRDPQTEQNPPPAYFGLTPKKQFLDIRWDKILRIHEVSDGKDRLVIACVHSLAKCKPLQYEPRIYEFILSPASKDSVQYISKVLNFAAFKNSTPPVRRFKIFINPKSGKGKAVKLFTTLVKPILAAAGCEVVDRIRDGSPPSISHVFVTTGPKEAMREAANIPLDNYDAILCVGGDGTVHEVVNGLANRPDGRLALERLPIAMIPAGSGNALSMSLFGACHPTYAAWQALKAKTIRADLMSVVQVVDNGVPPPPTEWAFMSLSFGWIAHADIHTEPLRFMGDVRFTAGIVWQMALRAKYESSLAVHTPLLDSNGPWWQQEITNRKQLKQSIIQHYNDEYAREPKTSKLESRDVSMNTLVGSKRPPEHWEQKGYKDMLCFYAGKLPWTSRDAMAFPAALSNDGFIDLCILRGKVGIVSMAKIFNGFDRGQHFNHDDVTYIKVKSFKLVPGVDYTGHDVAEIQPNVSAESSSDDVQAIQKRRDVDGRRFRSKFVFSVDGERMDPSHGVICEVQEGLVRFIADSKLQKYQPTSLLNTSAPVPGNGTLTESDSETHERNYKTSVRGLDAASSSQPLRIDGVDSAA